jgi:hypothetical protein
VYVFMCLKIVQGSVCFPTYRTYMWFFSCVHYGVCLEVTELCEAFPTFWTHMGFNACVHQHVLLEIAPQQKPLPTRITHMWLVAGSSILRLLNSWGTWSRWFSTLLIFFKPDNRTTVIPYLKLQDTLHTAENF